VNLQQAALENFRRLFEQAASQSDVRVPEASIESFHIHWRELVTWNKKINLTAIEDVREAVALHYVDSLAVLPALGNARDLLDVGSGAGFPGLVLAIARPHLKVHLVESIGKKVHFLKHVRRMLALPNVTVHESRVENLDPEMDFDFVTGRAVTDPVEFGEQLLGRIRGRGALAVFLKNERPPMIEGYQKPRPFYYDLPGRGGSRRIAVYQPS
jgi:16S rRNA (guanine527-N7)-methyltransferase